MNTAELSLAPVSNAASACEWVRRYFAYEGLPFNSTVEEGVSRLLESERFGWFFELMVHGEPRSPGLDAHRGHEPVSYGEQPTSLAVPSPLPSDGRGEGKGEVRVSGQAIGYAVLTRAFDHEIGGEYAILTDFFLLEPYRRQGHGSRALELLETFARSHGARAMDLYVLNRNAGVREFYHRHGFRDVADRRPMTKSLLERGPTVAP